MSALSHKAPMELKPSPEFLSKNSELLRAKNTYHAKILKHFDNIKHEFDKKARTFYLDKLSHWYEEYNKACFKLYMFYTKSNTTQAIKLRNDLNSEKIEFSKSYCRKINTPPVKKPCMVHSSKLSSRPSGGSLKVINLTGFSR